MKYIWPAAWFMFVGWSVCAQKLPTKLFTFELTDSTWTVLPPWATWALNSSSSQWIETEHTPRCSSPNIISHFDRQILNTFDMCFSVQRITTGGEGKSLTALCRVIVTDRNLTGWELDEYDLCIFRAMRFTAVCWRLLWAYGDKSVQMRRV